jgi:hypothetical protein
MHSYLFIGGNQDGLNIPVAPDLEAVQLPASVTGKDNYIAETLTVGDAAVVVYRHDSLTSQQVLDRLIEHYKAWCVNMPGSRYRL